MLALARFAWCKRGWRAMHDGHVWLQADTLMWPPSRERRSYNANGNKKWKSIEATRIYDVEHIQRFAKGTPASIFPCFGTAATLHNTQQNLFWQSFLLM